VSNDPASQERADEAHRKSVVLLRNDDNLLPLNDNQIKDVKLYIEVFAANNYTGITKGLKNVMKINDPSITITNNIEDATHAFVWVRPQTSTGSPAITIGPETRISNEAKAKINEIQKAIPTILAINMTSPWIIEDIEPHAAAVISTFNVKPEAVIDVIRGKYNPTGKMPFTIPANMKAVRSKAGDIPGYAADPSYAYKNKNGDQYWFDFGLSYPSDSELLNELKDLTEKYIEAGEISGPVANQLTNALKQSVHHLENGSKDNAKRFIENYESHLNRESNDRHVRAEAKENATKAARIIVQKWKITHENFDFLLKKLISSLKEINFFLVKT
jgi:beta-glucosidase